MKIHPFANLFPMCSDEEIQQLADDIAKNGLRQNIVTDQDEMILDGRNRAAACIIAGVKPVYEPFVGTDAQMLAYVVSVNIHRRHLTTAQRAEIAAQIATMSVGDNQHSKKKKEGPSNDGGSTKVSTKAAAKLLNVSASSVERAKAAKKPSKAAKPATDEKPDNVPSEEFPEDETMAEICQRETSEIESWARKFGELLKQAQKALSAVPTLDELNARDGWERKLKEALATLRGTKPVVCPICQGDGTDKCPCGGHGRVTKQQHGQMVK